MINFPGAPDHLINLSRLSRPRGSPLLFFPFTWDRPAFELPAIIKPRLRPVARFSGGGHIVSATPGWAAGPILVSPVRIVMKRIRHKWNQMKGAIQVLFSFLWPLLHIRITPGWFKLPRHTGSPKQHTFCPQTRKSLLVFSTVAPDLLNAHQITLHLFHPCLNWTKETCKHEKCTNLSTMPPCRPSWFDEEGRNSPLLRCNGRLGKRRRFSEEYRFSLHRLLKRLTWNC
jgi:hypothetical protein